jgi:cytidylate kinase
VITSWTLPWIWKGGIKIWLSASQLERARRIARRSNLSMKEALRLIKQRDDENIKLYKRLYGYELEKDLEAFDLIVDNEGVTPAEILRNLLRVLKDEFGIVKL